MNMKKLLLLSIAGLMSFSSFADEQVCHPTVQATTPDSRFEILGDGSEVKDTKTNLIWQRCSIGQTWDKTAKTCQGSPKTFASWKEALTETHKLGNGYRLPNVKELQSIVEYKCRPFINKKIFVGYDGDVTDWYFSSTPDVRDNNVFSVNFDKSTTRSVGKLDITNTARAVRSAK